MTRKIAFALTALVTDTRHRRDRGPRRDEPSIGRPGRHERPTILLGATTPLSGAHSSYASVRDRRERLLQVRQRQRRRATAARSRTSILDDAVQPGADGAVDPAARRAGQGLRDLQRARHRAQPRRPRLPEREQGAAALRRLRRDDVRPRRERSTRTRSASSRATRPRAGSTGKYLARTQTGREGRRALPERRLRQGPAQRPQARAPAVEGQDRRSRAVRVDLRRRPVAGREAEELGRRHASPCSRRRKFAIQAYVYREQARLEAEARRSTTPSRRPRTS